MFMEHIVVLIILLGSTTAKNALTEALLCCYYGCWTLLAGLFATETMCQLCQIGISEYKRNRQTQNCLRVQQLIKIKLMAIQFSFYSSLKNPIQKSISSSYLYQYIQKLLDKTSFVSCSMTQLLLGKHEGIYFNFPYSVFYLFTNNLEKI